MESTYSVESFGPQIPNLKNTDMCDLSLGFSGLRVAVCLGKDEHEDDRFVEIVFTAPRGFRYLDEGDLLPYWRSNAFDTSRYLVFEIKHGGWAEQEERSGMFRAANTSPMTALHSPRRTSVLSSSMRLVLWLVLAAPNVTAAVGNYREWFITSSNACLNVISAFEPMVRFL